MCPPGTQPVEFEKVKFRISMLPLIGRQQILSSSQRPSRKNNAATLKPTEVVYWMVPKHARRGRWEAVEIAVRDFSNGERYK